jgi:hypothetical protein
MLVISDVTQRRFVLGRQGLYTGRRFRGYAGVCEAVRDGCVVQVDPLSVVAPSYASAPVTLIVPTPDSTIDVMAVVLSIVLWDGEHTPCSPSPRSN